LHKKLLIKKKIKKIAWIKIVQYEILSGVSIKWGQACIVALAKDNATMQA